MPMRRRACAALLAALTVPLFLSPPSPVEAAPAQQPPAKVPVATGSGGAVASVNPYASRAGLEMLRQGGNAVDAAVATAAALGVVEPYSAGVGGGGFFTYYDAKTGKVHTIDGRETAPARMRRDSFIDPATGGSIPFKEAVNSGLSVGVPGTPATWENALDAWGTMPLSRTLAPGTRIADEGFVVNAEFRAQTAMNEDRFRDFSSTSDLFLPGGELPRVGSRFRNPGLASTYRLLARDGLAGFYGARWPAR
jgi:gamma-glutamyltranspeptidase/glutathione hydrolase